MPRTDSPAAGCWLGCSASMTAAPAAWAVASDILWCLGLGCLLGAVRDLADFVPGGGPVRCFLWDVAAFAAAAVLVCGFAAGVSSSGVARWYMAAGTLGGALAWYGAVRKGLHRALGMVRRRAHVAVSRYVACVVPPGDAVCCALPPQLAAGPPPKSNKKDKKTEKAVAKPVKNSI